MYKIFAIMNDGTRMEVPDSKIKKIADAIFKVEMYELITGLKYEIVTDYGTVCKYVIFARYNADKKLYFDDPLDSFMEALRHVEVYRKSNPSPYYFIKDLESGDEVEP